MDYAQEECLDVQDYTVMLETYKHESTHRKEVCLGYSFCVEKAGNVRENKVK